MKRYRYNEDGQLAVLTKENWDILFQKNVDKSEWSEFEDWFNDMIRSGLLVEVPPCELDYYTYKNGEKLTIIVDRPRKCEDCIFEHYNEGWTTCENPDFDESGNRTRALEFGEEIHPNCPFCI